MPSILIVDDAPGVLQMLHAVFSRAGYEVVTAADGESAMQLCRGQSFAVVLSDMRMPGTSGCELARWIAGSCPTTRTVLMSAAEMGCDDCPFAPRCTILRKPFRLGDVIAAVERITGHG